jgi:hypothetical protein
MMTVLTLSSSLRRPSGNRGENLRTVFIGQLSHLAPHNDKFRKSLAKRAAHGNAVNIKV